MLVRRRLFYWQRGFAPPLTKKATDDLSAAVFFQTLQAVQAFVARARRTSGKGQELRVL